MSKKVLVIYYSQSGQLGEIINNLTAPIAASENTVEIVRVKPATEYPFPWNSKSFFAQMPDCVLNVPTQLQPFLLKEKAYDLIIFGYQAWFLSPSIPSISILNDSSIKAVIKNCPVITVTGARNMWLSAMDTIRNFLKVAEANHVSNIALVDKNPNLISFVTIQYWMFTGKRDKYLNIFPKPGVAEKDIKNCKIFGNTITKYLANNNFEGMQAELINQKAVEVKYSLMFIESKAKKIFTIWANFISKQKNKTAWLVAFKYYLIIALLVVAPILLTVNAILFKPFLSNRIKMQKQYFLGVN